MAERKGRGRKISIVHIAQILLSESDAEHPLSQQQIMVFLRERYGMEMDRKAVRRNLEALRGGGLPVVCREVERVIEGKPAPLSLMELATSKSQFFRARFFRAFASTFSVSMAKPINN